MKITVCVRLRIYRKELALVNVERLVRGIVPKVGHGVGALKLGGEEHLG